MDTVHLHLVLSHVPVVGIPLLGLLFAFALARRSDETAKAAMSLLFLIGVAAVVVYFTGESAEEAIEDVPGFSEAIVERHETAAKIAAIVTATLGGLALIALAWMRRRRFPQQMIATALVACIAASGWLAYTANLGGQVRHTEIRATDAAAQLQEEED